MSGDGRRRDGGGPLVAEVSLSGGALVLGPTLAQSSGRAVELDAETCTTTGARHLFFTVANAREEDLRETLRADDTVGEASLLAHSEGRSRFWAPVSDDATPLTAKAAELGVFVMEGLGRGQQWTLRVTFADREHLRRLRAYFRERGVRFRVRELYHGSPAEVRHGVVSKGSAELLLTAYNRGYYDVPRAITQDVLADELGISSSAVSKRLRRATADLVESTLFPE